MSYYFSRSSIKSQGHTGQKESLFLTRIERFQTVTPVWLHQWIWNDAQSLVFYWRGALLFCEVIHQISRQHRLKNRQLESNFSKINKPVAAIKSLRFALFIQENVFGNVVCKVALILSQPQNVLMGWHNFIYNCTTQRGAVIRCHFRWMLSIYFCLQCKSHYHMCIVGVKVITAFAYCQGHHLLNCLWNGFRGDGDPSSVFNSWHRPDYLVEPGH